MALHAGPKRFEAFSSRNGPLVSLLLFCVRLLKCSIFERSIMLVRLPKRSIYVRFLSPIEPNRLIGSIRCSIEFDYRMLD